MRRRIADLCSGAGGAAMGYYQAGFEVVGFDIKSQPRYPFEFHQLDVFEIDPSWLAAKFDLIHVSPPCQGYSITRHSHLYDHPRLIPAFRALIMESGLPYVIENVEGARTSLHDPILLCGSTYGLRVRRHRLFEVSENSIPEPRCNHYWQDHHPIYKIYTNQKRSQGRGYRMSGIVQVNGGTQIYGGGGSNNYYPSVAMGIDWMTPLELNEAIPPAYTRYLGQQIRQHWFNYSDPI